MTLDEAIKHLDEVIEKMNCCECKSEHEQLREWLIELQDRRDKESELL